MMILVKFFSFSKVICIIRIKALKEDKTENLGHQATLAKYMLNGEGMRESP